MITVLFFAHLQDQIGKERLELNIASITLSELKEQLRKEYHLTNLDQVMFAVNEEYATGEDMIKAGDTVALIPPVSGG